MWHKFVRWVVVASLVGGGVYSLLIPGERVDPAWNSDATKKDVAAALSEFCGDLGSATPCKELRLDGKRYWLAFTIFDAEWSPPLNTVVSILEHRGWHYVGVNSRDERTYCRQRYSATVEIKDGGVYSVSFGPEFTVCR